MYITVSGYSNIDLGSKKREEIRSSRPCTNSQKRGPMKADHNLKPLSVVKQQRRRSVVNYIDDDKENNYMPLQKIVRDRRKRDSSLPRVRFEDEPNSGNGNDVISTPQHDEDLPNSKRYKRTPTLSSSAETGSDSSSSSSLPVPVISDVKGFNYPDQLRKEWKKIQRRSSDRISNRIRCPSIPRNTPFKPVHHSAPTSPVKSLEAPETKVSEPKLEIPEVKIELAQNEQNEAQSVVVPSIEQSVDDEIQAITSNIVSNSNSSESETETGPSPSYCFLPNGAIDTYSFGAVSSSWETPQRTSRMGRSRRRPASVGPVMDDSRSTSPDVRSHRSITSLGCDASSTPSMNAEDLLSPDHTASCFSSNLKSSKRLSGSRSSLTEKMGSIKTSVKKQFKSLRRAMSVDSLDRKTRGSVLFTDEGKIRKSPSLFKFAKSKKEKRKRYSIDACGDVPSETPEKQIFHHQSYSVDGNNEESPQSSVEKPRHFRAIGRLISLNRDGTQSILLNKPPHGPFGFYITRTDGKVFISRMTDSYPERFFAGLVSVGDEIVEIDGKDIKEVSLDGIYDMLASTTSLVLKVRSKMQHTEC